MLTGGLDKLIERAKRIRRLFDPREVSSLLDDFEPRPRDAAARRDRIPRRPHDLTLLKGRALRRGSPSIDRGELDRNYTYRSRRLPQNCFREKAEKHGVSEKSVGF